MNKFQLILNSNNKNCLVVGDSDFKVVEVLSNLSEYAPNSRVLVRTSNKNEIWRCLGRNYRDYNIECGRSYRVGNLMVYFDTINITSQRNTPNIFDYIIMYPTGSLTPLFDTNIDDIINLKKSNKIFWVKGNSPDIGWLKFICDIKEIVDLSEGCDADNIHECNIGFDKLLVDELNWFNIESEISKVYRIGSCKVDVNELKIGDFKIVMACGQRKCLEIAIKVGLEKENDKFVIYAKCKGKK